MNSFMVKDRPRDVAVPCASSDPDIFLPPNMVVAAQAAKLCSGCPMVQACLETAVRDRMSGVFGGILLMDGEPSRKVRSYVPGRAAQNSRRAERQAEQ